MDNVNPKGKPLKRKDLIAKTEEFSPLEIRRAVKEASPTIKSYLESE